MRDALIAHSRGECDTPMPMHLDIPPAAGEVHIKSSYRRGGNYFALKIATTFPGNVPRGLASGNGMMLLSSAETGAPVALLADDGHLTDVRTAAVAAMVARELGRRDTAIGILGTGIQARLQARMHAGGTRRSAPSGSGAATPERRRGLLPRPAPAAAEHGDPHRRTPAEVARPRPPDRHRYRLPHAPAAFPATSSRARTFPPSAPIRPVSRNSIPQILRRAALLLADSRAPV